MSLQFKAFLYEDKPGRPKEIRRFAVDQDVSSSYDYLRRKVATVFPNLGEDNFALQWRDTDGDLIWFNSDEELIQALGQLNTDVFRLYIKQNGSSQSDGDAQESRGPRCGRRRNCGPGFQGPFGPWMAPPPYGHFGPRFQPPPFPFFQSPSEGQEKKPEEKSQESTGCGSSSQQQSQGQFAADSYLKHMGNAVADFLQPFGIDVDINVEHKGKQEKCPGSQKPETSDQGQKQDTAQDKSRDSPDETDWTFLKKDGAKSEDETKESTGEDKMETDEDGGLKAALSQLMDMGFNDHGGWLTNLLKTYNCDISRVLEAMQPAQGSK
uniref:Sequestosome-1 n=1 Tax=Phallusia mammillata TaxID=59560 RepID=A0A6F9DSZ6_9ASCI|nr:sequestosome-1 [Phallusia mammillata]